MADSSIPPISKALIEWLQATYPDRCPQGHESDREVWMAAGAARVVRKLQHEFNQQTQSALETNQIT